MASVDLQEKANFTRLSRLLVDKGTKALRNTLDSVHSPANLLAVLAANRTSLLKLKPRVINNSQWDLLFPPSGDPPDSKTFDVTLLTVLFRNICGLPSTGWSAMPLDTDRSMQANIVRIKVFRNEVYAHVTSTQVDNATFESLWQKITKALVELNVPQNDVDDLKTCPLGPEEDIYVKMLEDWKLQEDECMKVLEGLNSEVKSIKVIVEENRDGIKQLCQSTLEQQSNIEALQRSITRTSQVSEDTNVEKNCSKTSDEDLLVKLAKHNFKGKIRSKVKFFLPGTRKWLLKQVDEFVENVHESRMLLLTAGPGFGKSVFAAKVCEDFKKKGKLAASHFCDFCNSNLRDPMRMLESLASQMCENVVDFKEKLLDQLKRPHQVRSLKDAFRIYLQNPLDELELDEASLVVIDGLDESAADDKNEIINLITDYFPDLPECIKILVTSRPEISVERLSDVQRININHNDFNNNFDLELYLKACLPSLADRKVNMNDTFDFPDLYMRARDIYNILAKKCEGSFLYAFYVQSGLQKRGDLDKITFHEIIKFLPEGLDSIYQAYFERLEVELQYVSHENLDVLKILEMLAVAEGPLPLIFVTRALGLAPDCRETKNIVKKVNETISCLLYVSDDLVTVFHKSVIDWLLAMGYKDHEYAVKVSDANKSLWLICEQVFEEIKTTVSSGHDINLTVDVNYALDHGLQHLVACNMKESFFWLVDVVIIHVLLTIDPRRNWEYILNLWEGILQGAVVISDELRARILWHVLEMDCLRENVMLGSPHFHNINLPFHYLQSVLTHSPKAYFSDNEKKIAESLLSNVRRFVEFNFVEVEVMPLAAWHQPPTEKIRAVGVAYDKTMVAVALQNGRIYVLSVPSLVELWSYSTKCKGISCCTFAPDDSFVLFGKLETALNIDKRKEVPFLHGIDETFTSCAFSPNGNRLVTCDGSSTVKLWDVAKQSLLSLLCAEVPVNWCSFSSTGLFIIGDRKCNVEDSISEDSESDAEDSSIEDSYYDAEDCVTIDWGYDNEDSLCVWNAITWQRSDERNLADELGVSQSRKCQRCHRLAFKEQRFEIEPCMMSPYKNWSTEIYDGRKCIFFTTHFTRNFYEYSNFMKIAAIVDDLLFYVDWKKLIVFRRLAATQEQSPCLPRPTLVLWSSFSPDGSRLATCTSDGCIKIWNVYTSQVEQRFKSSHAEPLFACCWSEKFLFVFEFVDGIPSLSKYSMDNLKILFSQSQQVSLCHLVDEFVPLSAIVDFSERFLSFECGGRKPVKVIDVNGVGRPRMVTLPRIKPMMNITVSLGASFVFGGRDKYFIWKRNAKEEPAVYEVFFTPPYIFSEQDFDDTFSLDSYSELEYNESYSEIEHDYTCCFSNDSKVAVVADKKNSLDLEIIDLDTGYHKRVYFYNSTVMEHARLSSYSKLFCINKDRVVIIASDNVIQIFDIDSGALLASSFQRYLTYHSQNQTKISPKETIIAFPKINGDMVFCRLCIPPNPMLSSIKREAAIPWENFVKRNGRGMRFCSF